jgi:hypothetical protein
MQTSKHTPGPWEYTEFTKPGGEPIASVGDVAETVAFSARQSQRAELFGVSLSAPGEDRRAVVVCYTGNGPNSHNNARLIAAAPELLAALNQARAALRMLTTRLCLTDPGDKVELGGQGPPWTLWTLAESLEDVIAPCDAALRKAEGETHVE